MDTPNDFNEESAEINQSSASAGNLNDREEIGGFQFNQKLESTKEEAADTGEAHFQHPSVAGDTFFEGEVLA